MVDMHPCLWYFQWERLDTRVDPLGYQMYPPTAIHVTRRKKPLEKHIPKQAGLELWSPMSLTANQQLENSLKCDVRSEFWSPGRVDSPCFHTQPTGTSMKKPPIALRQAWRSISQQPKTILKTRANNQPNPQTNHQATPKTPQNTSALPGLRCRSPRDWRWPTLRVVDCTCPQEGRTHPPGLTALDVGQ